MTDVEIGIILCKIQSNECPRCLIKDNCNLKSVSIKEVINNREKYSYFLQLIEKYKSCHGKSPG